MKLNEKIKPLRSWLMLFSTQSLSGLGSGMTNFALVLWLYQKNGSALETALLSICSYAPYVLMSIFAGAISDRWNKRAVLLICDTLAAVCTLVVLYLLRTEQLVAWHLYALNALNGLMHFTVCNAQAIEHAVRLADEVDVLAQHSQCRHRLLRQLHRIAGGKVHAPHAVHAILAVKVYGVACCVYVSMVCLIHIRHQRL